MGLASYLVNEAARQPFASAETKRVAGIVQTLYWVQLGLNMLWRCVPTFCYALAGIITRRLIYCCLAPARPSSRGVSYVPFEPLLVRHLQGYRKSDAPRTFPPGRTVDWPRARRHPCPDRYCLCDDGAASEAAFQAINQCVLTVPRPAIISTKPRNCRLLRLADGVGSRPPGYSCPTVRRELSPLSFMWLTAIILIILFLNILSIRCLADLCDLPQRRL